VLRTKEVGIEIRPTIASKSVRPGGGGWGTAGARSPQARQRDREQASRKTPRRRRGIPMMFTIGIDVGGTLYRSGGHR